MLNDFPLLTVQELMQDFGIERTGVIQQLWSGYGEIFRCGSRGSQHQFVVKYIAPPEVTEHPKGWSSQVGHQRKLYSYAVEQEFYQHYSPFTEQSCRVPLYYAGWDQGERRILVLEDLAQQGYQPWGSNIEWTALRTAIHWLAAFHSCFVLSEAEFLWSRGGYWHLSTRKDEWLSMEAGELKEWAGELDQQLRGARYQTLIHGDAKLANLCFREGLEQVAAVDFQYTGKGVGLQDLMLLMASCLSYPQLIDLEQKILREYFVELKSMLQIFEKPVDFAALEEEWRTLWPIIWADFERFLQGWSPEHVRITPHMQQHSQKAVSYLKQNN